jgi:act minimal PKS acyl carrier protein
MAGHEVTIDDLKRILREAAGEDEGINLDGDILDQTFTDLGYDSLALLETGGRIEREHGISLDDSTIADSKTPRALLAAVNEQLAARVG